MSKPQRPRQAPERLVPENPLNRQRNQDMAKALQSVMKGAARGPAARPRARAVFQ